MWSKEKTDSYENENIEEILQPKYSLIDNQEDIIKQIHFEDYYKKLGNWTNLTKEMTRYLIRNMILALYSKKCITSLLESKKSEYDYVLFLRPDIEILTPLDITILSKLNDTNIFVPADDWYTGCNDRMAICKMNSALYYGKLFDSLLTYSLHNSIISEKYLYDMLKKKNIDVLKTNIKLERIRIKKSS